MQSEPHTDLVVSEAPARPGATPRLTLELFEAAARRWPSAIALEQDDNALTYAELDARAERLARSIAARGLGSNPFVAICVDRSIGMLVAVLGALKSGAAYVPFLPDEPPERTAAMVEVTRPALLIASASIAVSWRERRLITSALAIDPDGTFAEDAHDDASPPRSVEPSQWEYVMFTSGSTGRPKAVPMRRAALGNLASWHVETDRYPGATTLQYAALTFDISYQEMFATWAGGGRLVIAPEAAVRNADALLELLTTKQISRLFLTPSRLVQVAHAAAAHPAPALQEIICAGEPLRLTRPIRAFLTRLPGVALENHYGATETHVVTRLRLEGDPAGWPEAPSVGTPITGARIEILNDDLEVVPAGTPGELYIGGICIAEGYLGDPKRTAERFVPDPGSGEGSRLYRTGDIGVRLPDRTIEVRGRSDDQINVRGFRVELGEVETAILRHPDVGAAAVVGVPDASGGLSLEAFVVASSTPSPSVRALRQFLEAKLPSHMLPRGFAVLDRLPYTSGGKIDRQKLTKLTVKRCHSETRDPGTPLERRLLKLWRELLGSDDVGVDDDFFDLGGHSLLAVRLFERMDRELGHRLPLATLDSSSTVASLARAVSARDAPRAASLLIRLGDSEARSPTLGCVHGPGGDVLKYRALASHLSSSAALWGLRAEGVDTSLLPLRPVAQLASSYLSALEPLRRQGPIGLIGFCFGGLVAYELARLLAAAGEPPSLLALVDTANPARYEPPSSPHTPCRGASDDVACERRPGQRFGAWRRRLGLALWDRLGYDVLSVGSERLEPLHACQLAQLAHTPRTYPGRVDLFVASRESPTGALGWEGLTSLTRHEIEATHESIMADGAAALARGIGRALTGTLQ